MSFFFSPQGTQQTYPALGSSLPTTSHSSRPVFIPPAATVQEAVRSTAADVRLQETLGRPAPVQPTDDDIDMNATAVDDDVTYSTEVEEAFSHLLRSLDDPQTFSIDEEHYYALSELPLTYPWPSFFFLLLCCAHRDSLYPRNPILGNWRGRLGTLREKTKTQTNKPPHKTKNHKRSAAGFPAKG